MRLRTLALILALIAPASAGDLRFHARNFPLSKLTKLRRGFKGAYKKSVNCKYLKAERPKLRAALTKAFENETIPFHYERSEEFCGARELLPFSIMLTDSAFSNDGQCFDLPSVILHEMIHHVWDGWIFSNITEDEIEDVLTYCLSY